jgi:hypothetical protein
MSDGARDRFHVQKPIGAFASLQSDGAGEARIKKHRFNDQDGQQYATAD